MTNKIKITTDNLEDFTKISELLAALPELVRAEIESAKRSLLGLECIIEYKWKERQDIIIPKGTTQICDFDDSIIIYCDPYYFRIAGKLYETKKFNYIFV